MRYLEMLREGDRVSEVYLCKVKQVSKTKAGKSYYSLILQDKTGSVDAKIWELGAGIDHFESMDYIKVDGDVTSFQGSVQLNIRRVRRASEGEYVPEDYLPVSSKDLKQMYHELVSFVNSIKNDKLRQLVSSFFVEDKEFVKRFVYHSAAKSVHHSFVGGLLEHTLGVVKLCDFYATRYPLLNRDLLLSAAMFHDIGKTEELSAFPQNDYTDEGQLLGHIMIGTEMIGARIRSIPNFPGKLAVELKHCILSHHGELEYGSPKKPALIEAVALSMADNTDAKIQTMTEIMQGAGDNSDWLGYNRFFESNLRKTSVF